ncbi:MAG: zinc ABC transporter substrate-binding protein [Lautropia sp.]|nr:zinc ABC transporter substrate-binding protein [Lautropia sp.]
MLSDVCPPRPPARRPVAPQSTARLMAACVLSAPLLVSSPAHASLDVFACEPEWAALVHELLPTARLHTATHDRQDPHHIEARPSLIAALRRAELAVCTGAALESGWLPMLQQRAGNPRVQEGEPGLFLAAHQVQLLDPHAGFVSPFDGDIHPEGNPHLHLDPERLPIVAQALAHRLAQLAPADTEHIRQRHHQWQADWRRHLQRWQAVAAPLRGMPVVIQHNTFSYLWRWAGIRPVADLEPRPGLPPTPGHLRRVLGLTRQQEPQAIITAHYQDPRPAHWLSAQLPGQPPVLQLPATVSPAGKGEVPTLAALFDTLLHQLRRVHDRHNGTATAPSADDAHPAEHSPRRNADTGNTPAVVRAIPPYRQPER